VLNVSRSTAAKRRWTPLIEPAPGLFHGPKISQIVSAVATKSSPGSPEMWFASPKVFSPPARTAQNAIPRATARTMKEACIQIEVGLAIATGIPYRASAAP
jgi:hypothetical protein